MELFIYDGQTRQDAVRLFIDAAGYWEKLLMSENLITAEARLPDRIIRAAQFE
jgi:hypothetical protein